MARILIAGIGSGKTKENGKYKESTYEIEGKKYIDRSFISSALEEHYQIDKSIYIGTVGSMWDNLYLHYIKKYHVDEDSDYLLHLITSIDNANSNSPLEMIDIERFHSIFDGKVTIKLTKYGMNETEIFENFNIIMDLQDLLSNGDEIYIDITHSFRSNAMWMFLVMYFITNLLNKNVTIKAISYGMLEVYNEKGFAPVIDLNAFYTLLRWIKDSESFKNYGNSYDILEMIPDKQLSNKLRNFSNAMNMNYIASLKENVNALQKLLPQIEVLEGPIKLLIPDIVKTFIHEFSGMEKEYLIQAKLAKWHYEQKRYAMSCINVNESIIGFFNEIFNFQDRNKSKQTLWKIKGLYKRFEKDPEYKKLYKYAKIFEHTRKIRNESAHSLGEKSTAFNDIDSLKKYCEEIESLLQEETFVKRVVATYSILENK